MTMDRIIETIADAKGKQPDELAFALQEHVDVDAIQQLSNHNSDSWAIEFEVPGHTVRVTGHGEIFVEDAGKQTPAGDSDTGVCD